jgi:hypothetical protein
MADRSIAYRFLGHDAGLGKTMSGLGDKSESLHRTLGKLAGAFGAGLTVGGAAEFLKGSINNASDLNESLSKTRVVFGQASKGVEVFAKAASRGIGQSEQQALEATSTFGNLFRALGIGTKPAADLSVKIVKLAGDLASFNNTNPADALEALKSGLLGEAEPLRKYGVTLSAVRVQAEAMADGIVKPVKDGGKVKTALLNVEVATNRLAKAQKDHGAKSLAAKTANDALVHANEALAKATKGTVPELNAAQKAQASYNIIMKDTKTAQGDFARTSGGLANQQRILKAEFADASAQLGTKLYPAATKVVSKLADALQPGSKFTKVLGDLGDRAKEFADDAKPIFTWIGDHPHLFTQIAKDAVIFGGALKAKSFLTGMGLLKGISGGGLGRASGGLGRGSSLGGGLGKGAVPVFVTNQGFGRPGAPGVPGPISGPSTFNAIGPTTMYAAAVTNVPWDKRKLNNLADDPKTRKLLGAGPTDWEKKVASSVARTDMLLDDPKRGRALRNDVTDLRRGVVQGGYATPVTKGDLKTLLTPGVPSKVTNNYYFHVDGVTDVNKLLAQAHQKARIAAVGGVNNPATRDRG